MTLYNSFSWKNLRVRQGCVYGFRNCNCLMTLSWLAVLVVRRCYNCKFHSFCVQHKCFAIGKEYLVHISWKYCKISKQIFQFPAFNCFVLLPTQNLLDSKESTPKNSRKENIVLRYNWFNRNITKTYIFLFRRINSSSI